MRRVLLNIIAVSLIAAAAFFAGPVSGGQAEVARFSAIEFRGLHYLSRFEITRRVRLRSYKDGILIDLASCRKVLEDIPLIETYSLSRRGGRLVISLQERVPAREVILTGKGKGRVQELDARNRVVSERIHRSGIPFIFIDERFAVKGHGRDGLNGLMTFLDKVQGDLPSLYREISEIYYINDSTLKLFLRGRKTAFFAAPAMEQFVRLYYMAGHCDSSGVSPGSVDLREDKAVIR